MGVLTGRAEVGRAYLLPVSYLGTKKHTRTMHSERWATFKWLKTKYKLSSEGGCRGVTEGESWACRVILILKIVEFVLVSLGSIHIRVCMQRKLA